MGSDPEDAETDAWESLSTFDQNGEPLLGEMMVVGQHLGKAHLTHSVHGNTSTRLYALSVRLA
jgi:hypothetical protein